MSDGCGLSRMSHCSIPPTSLLPGARYDKMAACFGARGYNVASPQELRGALNEVLSQNGADLPAVINVIINTSSERKAQVIKLYYKPIINVLFNLL